MKLELYLNQLVEWLQAMVKQANAKGLIVGVSGGIDSAVVVNLAKKAFPNNVLALIMPCESNQEDALDGVLVCQQAKVEARIIDLTSTYQLLRQTFQTQVSFDNDSLATKLAFANTKARLRMTTLYAIGQSLGYLVVGTDNWDEWHTGYFTKYGDGGVDLVPIIHLTKGEVKQAAALLGVPEKIITRKPTAGLIQGVFDEDELRVSYPVIDAYLLGEKIDKESQTRIEQLHEISAHKRTLAKAPHPFLRK
jgi:NAD+ synthase